MTDPSTLPTTKSKPPGGVSRSLGTKLIVILALVVLMAIPVMFISAISFERSSRADDVSREVSQTYGGAQQLLGPILVVPYRETLVNGGVREGDYIVSATSGDAVFEGITVEEKSRSLYKVPVYSADGRLRAVLPPLSELPAQSGLIFDLDQAKILVGLADVTGLQSDVILSDGVKTLTFEPYSSRSDFNSSNVDFATGIATESALTQPGYGIIYDRLDVEGFTLLSVPANEILGLGPTDVEARMAFTGANRLSVSPYAKSTRLRVSSDWPHPGFAGRFPPGDRDISDVGFTADWSVPYLRRGMAAEGRAMDMNGLVHGTTGQMEVNFVSPLNPYQTVNRALKYAILFIGLVFLAYFLMETLLGVRVHPAQYLLIGIAQAVFYLLLLAFAEHIGFTPAFILSAVATVVLTAGYAGAVFGRDLIWKSALVFGAVYALLFVLMRIQDFALMVGALISFIAIAATLYLTRNMDWYGDKMPTE
ncbi:cell envelope integrity protein CreD [Algimonas arctica]|uniref:Cell envelope integrity protein CreD n=1 Tax=Algimonas arctica TaxID=1479486 RepID=A0A8J3CRQ8_9PROT|nr:cell envelope integrity protein CreD [Algimonas arctica]GHA99687.1 cell envelope integrity protein CreD [Algimonas arctica]